jgi:hypothetical protein
MKVMLKRTSRIAIGLFFFSIVVRAIAAPPGPPPGAGANAGGANPAPGGSGGATQGISWAHQTWDNELGLPAIKDRAVLCYVLNYGNSITTPLTGQLATGTRRKIFDVSCQDAHTKDDPQGAKICKGKENDKNATWNPCTDLNADTAILMNQTLVIGIAKPEKMRLDALKILTLNVTTQQGQPINPTPIRNSFSATATAATNLAGGPYFLTWPDQIPGDVLPTVSVTGSYTPPMPGTAWQSGTFYPQGSVVTSSPPDGHYYTALKSGVSAPTGPPAFNFAATSQIQDGSTIWVDSGPTASAQGASGPTVWTARTQYNRGQVIQDIYNGHFYTNIAPGKQTCTPAGAGAPPTNCETSGAAPVDPFSIPTIADGTVLWVDRGDTFPAGVVSRARQPAFTYAAGDWIGPVQGRYFQASEDGKSLNGDIALRAQAAPARVVDGTIVWTLTPCGAAAVSWSTAQSYAMNALVKSANGYCYSTASAGVSGLVPSQPYFSMTTINTMTNEQESAGGGSLLLTWIDSGTAPPPSVAGGQPAETPVTLFNYQYAQSHSLSYFNLAAGIMYSKVQSKTYGFTGGSPSATPPVPPTAVETGHSRTVDPALLFTVYPIPFDAEVRCGFKCLWTTPPGLSLGLSLANPSSSFYAGVSLELVRNVQFVVGENWSKQAVLPPSGTTQSASAITAGAPNTVQRYTGAPFVGLTFNISGFIQSLFPGGGSKSPGS